MSDRQNLDDLRVRAQGDRLFAPPVGALPALVAALDAVLALHQPDDFGYPDLVVCVTCDHHGDHEPEIVFYPCPTVRAIHARIETQP